MVRFVRCNALLSLALDAAGKGCRYIAKADTDDDVVKDMSEHMNSVHGVDVNGQRAVSYTHLTLTTILLV